MTTSDEPYNMGIEAAYAGETAAYCQYEYHSPEGEEWLRGYEDGGGAE